MSGKTDLASFNNDWFDPGASRIKLLLWHVVSWAFFLNHLSFFSSVKCALLRIFGARVGAGVVIKQGVRIKYPWRLDIGDHVWIGECVWIENHVQVTIGAHSCISQGAFLLCGNHDYKKPSFDLITGPIVLEAGVWIGAKATVCPGVTCKTHSVLTVGSIASKDLDAYTIYRGNPCVAVRDRSVNPSSPNA